MAGNLPRHVHSGTTQWSTEGTSGQVKPGITRMEVSPSELTNVTLPTRATPLSLLPRRLGARVLGGEGGPYAQIILAR